MRRAKEKKVSLHGVHNGAVPKCLAMAAVLCSLLGCTDRRSVYLEDSSGRGVVCYGDPYRFEEGYSSFHKWMSCKESCLQHGFKELLFANKVEASKHKFIERDSNTYQTVPNICK